MKSLTSRSSCWEREFFQGEKLKTGLRTFFCKKKLWVHKNSYRKNAKLTFIYVSSSKILITALCCQTKSSTLDSLINFILKYLFVLFFFQYQLKTFSIVLDFMKKNLKIFSLCKKNLNCKKYEHIKTQISLW
jgi:uncharacterized membrane protein